MDKMLAQEIAEKAGFTWLTTKDYGDELLAFANIVAQTEREACAKACEAHADEPQIMRVTKITDTAHKVACLDCAELIRMRAHHLPHPDPK